MKSYKLFFIIPLILTALFSCKEKQSPVESESFSKPEGYMLPRVLILTTGTNKGNGMMAEGVILAAQTFNKNGAYVSMDSREILLKPEELSKFNILILPTAAGYHDADRKYSLTYMSDEELKTLRDWVKNGGVLIAGDNIGRNLLDATDRTSLYGELTPGDWALGECFGISLIEKNMQGYRIDGNITNNLKGNFVPQFEDNMWALVVDTMYSDSIKVLANWVNDKEKIPALIQNRFGKGLCFLLPTYYLLHPANSGGYWSAEQITEFFNYVLSLFYKINHSTVHLNIWPEANNYAFCATLNATGSLEEFNRVLKLFKDENISPSIFVNQIPDSTIRNILLPFSLQSNGFAKIDNQIAQFYEINRNIISNEIVWKKKFTGFRFPFTRTSYWGFECLSKYGYKFDSSIGVDNLENFYGSAFPYNIAISSNSLYKYIDMLEISPVMNDDYYYYEKVLTNNYTQANIERDSKLYEKYLENFWEYAIKPYNGLMVYLGHPVYIGYNDSTLNPVKKIIKEIKSEKTWVTSIESVCDYWNKLGKARFYVNDKESYTEILVQIPDSITIENVSLKLDKIPESAEALEGECEIMKHDSCNYIVFDAFNNQKISVTFKK
ncbi:MAG TPA: hypothetical protein PKK00_10485 [Bacteroidales bacterium]|nr:hypothetical protein [Bacteroidales bacterium]HPS17750.1 hypothetical protein [Bacteroidales bacterium]